MWEIIRDYFLIFLSPLTFRQARYMKCLNKKDEVDLLHFPFLLSFLEHTPTVCPQKLVENGPVDTAREGEGGMN